MGRIWTEMNGYSIYDHSFIGQFNLQKQWQASFIPLVEYATWITLLRSTLAKTKISINSRVSLFNVVFYSFPWLPLLLSIKLSSVLIYYHIGPSLFFCYFNFIPITSYLIISQKEYKHMLMQLSGWIEYLYHCFVSTLR